MKKPDGKILMAFRLPPDLLADLRAVAFVTGTTATALVTDALRPALASIIEEQRIAGLVEKVKRKRKKQSA